MKASKHAKIMLMLVCAVLGFMIATQIKTTERQKTVTVQRAEELTERLRSAEQQRDDLAREVERLQANTNSNDVLEAEVQRLREFAGEVPLEGKGIQLVLDDSKVTAQAGENPNLYIIHDDDLLRVINELRAAGAEAISVNGERLVSTSEIRCAGPTLSVNNTRSAPPYVVLAIGNPSNLTSALKLRGGMLDTFKFWGIQAELTMPEKVIVPAFKGRRVFEYASVASDEEAKDGGQ